MSSKILICPSCNHVASLVELAAETVLDLVKSLTGGITAARAWEMHAFWCPTCHTPILHAWPAKLPAGERRELVGLPADLVEIDEGVQRG